MPATAGSKPTDHTADKKGWRHLGGASVHIGESGIIDAGCPGLEGEHIDHLDENRDERADRQEQAEQAGWKSQYHQDAEAAHAAIKPSTPEGSIALVRVGGKYHTFGDDAQHMQRVLGMGDGQHAEFDHEHLEDHLKNLVKNGHRVAIVERKEDQQPQQKAEVGPEHAEAIDADEDHEDSEPGRLPDMEKEEDDEQDGGQQTQVFQPSRIYTTAMGKKSAVNNALHDPSLFGDASDIEIALGAVSPEQQEDLAIDIKKVRPDLAKDVDDAMWGVMSWRQKMLPDQEPPQQVDQSHTSLATAQQHLQTAPPKMRHAIEAMHNLTDVKTTGTGSTTRLSPGYAQSLHDHLANMPGHSDGFGQVYDLSDHLGPGALGYHSPAGVLAMVPPQWQGQPWEARYSAETQPAAEQQSQTSPYVTPAPTAAPVDDGFGDPNDSYEGDSYEPDPVGNGAANSAATTAHLAELTKDHQGLAAAVKEAFPGNLELQAAAADMAIQEWQQHRDFNDEFKRQRRYLLNAMGGKDWGLKAARLKQAAERGDDTASAIKGFDTMAQAYQHEAPLMFTPLKWDGRRGRYVESGGSGERGQSLDSDATAALLDNLAKPEREFETPPPEDHRFLGAALDELDRWKDAASELEDSDQEAVPFSRRGQAAHLAGAV